MNIPLRFTIQVSASLPLIPAISILAGTFTFIASAAAFSGDPGCREMNSVVPMAINETCDAAAEWCDCSSGEGWTDIETIQDTDVKMSARVVFADQPARIGGGSQEDLLEVRRRAERDSARTLEEPDIGDAAYIEWESRPEGAIVPWEFSVLHTFVGDPDHQGYLEHNAYMFFQKGICGVWLSGETDIVVDSQAEPVDGETRLNEFHRIDDRKRQVLNAHLGFDHGREALRGKLLDAARQIESHFDRTGICEGYLVGEPKILDASVRFEKGEGWSNDYHMIAVKFENTGRAVDDFSVWIDDCRPSMEGVLTNGGNELVYPGETAALEFAVQLDEGKAAGRLTCNVIVRTGLYNDADDATEETRYLYFTDKRPVELVRPPKSERQPAHKEDSGASVYALSGPPPPSPGSGKPVPLVFGPAAAGAWIFRRFWFLILPAAIGGIVFYVKQR